MVDAKWTGFQVFFKGLVPFASGKSRCVTLDVEPDDTIDRVLSRLEPKVCMLKRRIRLRFDSQHLHLYPARTLREFGVTKESTIFVTPQLGGRPQECVICHGTCEHTPLFQCNQCRFFGVHKSCMAKWNALNPTCPICRAPT